MPQLVCCWTLLHTLLLFHDELLSVLKVNESAWSSLSWVKAPTHLNWVQTRNLSAVVRQSGCHPVSRCLHLSYQRRVCARPKYTAVPAVGLQSGLRGQHGEILAAVIDVRPHLALLTSLRCPVERRVCIVRAELKVRWGLPVPVVTYG